MMRYKKAAFAFSMLYAVCLLGIAGYWNKTKPVDAAVEVSEKPKIAITLKLSHLTMDRVSIQKSFWTD